MLVPKCYYLYNFEACMFQNAIIYNTLEPHDADLLLFARHSIRLLPVPSQYMCAEGPCGALGPFGPWCPHWALGPTLAHFGPTSGPLRAHFIIIFIIIMIIMVYPTPSLLWAMPVLWYTMYIRVEGVLSYVLIVFWPSLPAGPADLILI